MNPYYRNCSGPFHCSGSKVNVSFPFSLPDSPSYCGVPGYELNCSAAESEPSIRLHGVDYRVKNIDYDKGFLTLVESNFLGNSCPQTFTNASINSTLFDFADLDVNLTVYINCSNPIPSLTAIPCFNDPFGPYSYYKLDNGPSSFLLDLFGGCQLKAAVPLDEMAAMSLNSNSSKFGEVLKQGFGLKWTAGKDWCRGCIDSGGICGYNSTRASDPICFCPNNTALGSCPYERKESSKTGLIIGLSTAGGFSFIMFCSLCFLIYRRWKKKQSSSTSNFLDRSPSSAMSSKTDPELGSSVYTPIFSYDELYEATNAFDASKELGDGGFGTVYKGKLKDGRVVAVKRLYESNYRGAEQFMNEVKIVSLLRHQNLVSLYGCTSRHSRELLLVYEFIPNGTVADHLHGSRASESFLPWNVRINIAIETADALNYLHSVEPQIIHRDIKTNNIMLDNSFHVKVGDFGLSRLFPLDATHVSTAPQGTPGYLDPEYHKFFQLTDKSDVYSFGVVLMELISSMPAVDINRKFNEANLAYMAIKKIQRQELHELVDPRLGFHTDSNINSMISQVAELALQCLQSEREMRPAIKVVLEVLREIEKAGFKSGDCVEVGDAVKEEACLLKNIPPYSPNSVADRWISTSSEMSSFSG
ncbi:hypothetical protein KFK09_017394 [Dendrobium nobile]|uniref:Protein kinase domain-containing protein n=1 Tax=Dendrobium nobile TaxID=94219 RepID=A0A8T3B2E3_DENNO|nr:hypothetical protein KFK09_017394 [Dendrobium nobile]